MSSSSTPSTSPPSSPPSVFGISYSRFNQVFMGMIGLGPARARLVVAGSTVLVRFGWGFRATIERTAITEVEPYDGRVYGWGAHGWRGRWLVNGSSAGLLRLTIEPPAAARVCGWPVRLRELTVSLDDRDAVAALLSLDPTA